MYRRITVPVDLEHVDRLEKALKTAADLSKHYGAPVCYVGVATEQPGPIAHTPAEFERKLDEFARDQGARNGIETTAKTVVAHDLPVELDGLLLKAIEETEADAVVMASHVPGLIDHFFASNAGTIASEAKVSVFVIR